MGRQSVPAPFCRNASHEHAAAQRNKVVTTEGEHTLTGSQQLSACACSFSLISRASPKAYTDHRSPRRSDAHACRNSTGSGVFPGQIRRNLTDSCRTVASPARPEVAISNGTPVITQSASCHTAGSSSAGVKNQRHWKPVVIVLMT